MVVITAAFVALGTTGTSSAAAGMSVVLRPLIGTSSNDVQQVTFGGKIGFHLEVTNSGDSSVNHLVIAVASSAGTFSDASRSECLQDPADQKRMVCTLKQMKSGAATFSVDLRFDAPIGGSEVLTTPSVTVDARTQGGAGNNGTQTTTGTPVTTALVSSAANSLVKTFATGRESVATSTALPQHSVFTLPNALLGGVYGVETSVQETTGTPLCPKCPTYLTLLGIPASLLTDSPFSAANPFSFTVTLLPNGEPTGYKPIGLYHDSALVPMCSSLPLSSTTHICLTSFQTSKSGVIARGLADQNGRVAFG